MTAAALAAAGPPVRGEAGARGVAESAAESAESTESGESGESAESRETSGRGGDDGARLRSRRASHLVTAPVRIADAATVRLLRPGVRVDVVAAEGAGAGPAAGGSAPRVVAAGARVAQVPETSGTVAGDGALVLLSVPRSTAAQLVGASATARLAVTLR